jgi:serine/threonine protein kinase
MVMEYMRGGDFNTLLERYGFFNNDTSKFYLAHIVLALEALHNAGIVHRDLKPENILIGADGHIKLTDFGLSDAGLKNVMSQNQDQQSQKKSNRIVGTANYMAPETLRAEDVSVLMDFWSLGVVAFEILTGILPFNAEEAEQVF